VEFAGIGPGPYASMLLSDMGADVVTMRVPGSGRTTRAISSSRRRPVELDLKNKEDIAQALDLIASARCADRRFPAAGDGAARARAG